MLEKFVEYIKSSGEPEQWFQTLINMIYSGFVDLEGAKQITDSLASVEAYTDSLEKFEFFPADDLCDKNEDAQEYRPKLLLPIDTILKYKPDFVKSYWEYTKEPDNATATNLSNHLDFYHVGCIEATGFVKIGNQMVGRTIQPFVILRDRLGRTRVLEKTAVVIPVINGIDFQVKLFEDTYPTKPVMGGGVYWNGVYSIRKPTEEFKSLYGCYAKNVLVLEGLCGDGGPYPFTKAVFLPEFNDTRIYE